MPLLRLLFGLCALLATLGGPLPVATASEGLPLYYWQQPHFTNFGDYLSLKLIERIVAKDVRVYKRNPKAPERKLLAVGSILYFANEGDVVWGSGVNGKRLAKEEYQFARLDVRSVRGPLTRQFLIEHFSLDVPEVYGDPILLFPYFFPEFQRSVRPRYDYVIIPHYSEVSLFPKSTYPNVVYPTDDWREIVTKILDSKFVISSSLHGLVMAEAYGIPARMLRLTEQEPIFKYQDYYLGTNRPYFRFATSIAEALSMGGEPPSQCDLERLYKAFPFEFWGS